MLFDRCSSECISTTCKVNIKYSTGPVCFGGWFQWWGSLLELFRCMYFYGILHALGTIWIQYQDRLWTQGDLCIYQLLSWQTRLIIIAYPFNYSLTTDNWQEVFFSSTPGVFSLFRTLNCTGRVNRAQSFLRFFPRLWWMNHGESRMSR